ncbi:MrpF/PhaF family protein [Streptomyces sp. SL13]|uniref:MrpF/PhaF family protein n=1 Tax=Streptantibioticus silvisoli TaxID=2705255 RepID=A0AA90KFQ8_9ACTN|nr:MrpF/PhaF family protein [Streptantibioticus silvisoli]MDI5969209.1 MrpF/PhaF family protein [Streptantibioticus silvisoli]
MNAWLLAAAVLLTAGLPPCGWVVLRTEPHERVAGLNLASVITAVALLLMSQGFGRTSYQDLALVLSVTGPAGILVFARFLGGRGRDALTPPDAADDANDAAARTADAGHPRHTDGGR